MKRCPLSNIDANPEACLYIDCDFCKERKCDFPHAGGDLPITDSDGAYQLHTEESSTLLTIRIWSKGDSPTKAMFLMARELIDKAEMDYIAHKSKSN